MVGWKKSRERGFFITPLILFSLSKEEGPQLIVDEEGGSLLTHFFCPKQRHRLLPHEPVSVPAPPTPYK